MKKSFFLFCSILMLSSCAPKALKEDNVLRVVLSQENAKLANGFFDSFVEKYPDLKVEYTVMDEDAIDYYLRHDSLKGDVVLLTDLMKVNSNHSCFYDLTISDYLFRYRRYIQNFLKSDDGNMYCLPAPGAFYYYVYNQDILDEVNMNFPESLDDLVSFSSNISPYYRPSASSAADDSVYLDIFLQVMAGKFFSKSQGNQLLKEYVTGKTYIQDSPYFDQLMKYSQDYHSLFLSGYVNLEKESQENVRDFLDGKTAILSVSPSFDFIREYQNSNNTFNFQIKPYLGLAEDSGCLPTTSDFFVSVLNDAIVPGNLKKINAFLDFFTSQDGQEELMKDESGNVQINKLSYLNENTIRFQDKYSALNATVDSGNVFLVDTFQSAFTSSQNLLNDYANERISDIVFVDGLDVNMKNRLYYKANEYYLESLKDYDANTPEFKEACLLYIYELFRKKYSDNLFLIPKSFLRQPIFGGKLYENDFDVVFDEGLELSEYTLKGNQLSKIFSSIESSEDFFYRGLRKNNQGQLITDDRNPVNDEKEYRIMVPSGFLKNDIQATKVGDSVSVVSFISSALEEMKRR